jgi:hypothetical protein
MTLEEYENEIQVRKARAKTHGLEHPDMAQYCEECRVDDWPSSSMFTEMDDHQPGNKLPFERVYSYADMEDELRYYMGYQYYFETGVIGTILAKMTPNDTCVFRCH